MIVQLDNNLLYTTFDSSSFDEFESNIQNMAPSMVEYYLTDLSSNNTLDESAYINRSNIQQTVFIDEFLVHLDYNNDIYLEVIKKESEYDTESFFD